MSISAADSIIFGTLFGDAQIAETFSDEQFVRRLLQVEAALARVQADLEIIPAEAGQAIASQAATLQVDLERLRAGTEKSGIPVIELVRQLREEIGGQAATYVHWGATSQDIMDTALVLQLRSALRPIEERLQSLIHELAQLADRHRQTLMAGRTHSQQALPIPFGLKVAGWLAPLLRHRQRLAQLQPRLIVLQFGGAAGTLAALGESGVEVQEALATELKLGLPPIPWHTQRDNVAEMAGWLSLLSGSLAKMAQDVILLAQSEIGELRESADPSRGGSSTMPQKRNPITSEVIVAAARSNASLLASMHQALIQEQERATHGWQLEWLTLPQMLAHTAAALNKALFVSQNLVVDDARMRQNVAASRGLMMAEALSFALTPFLGRVEAKQLVREASLLAVEQERHLVDVVSEKSDAPLDWTALRDEAAYFGSSDAFIDRVLRQVERTEP